MLTEFDIFEKLPDGTIVWREVVSGLEPAVLRMKALASVSTNEFILLYSPSNKIVDRANVPGSK
jgi:hypothetical protein